MAIWAAARRAAASDPGGFSGRSRRRRTETLSRPFHIDQALLPKGARGSSLGGTVARPRSAPRDFAGENVTDASHALDEPRLVRRPLELASEPSDVSIDRAIERRPVVPQNVSRDLVAGEHPRRVFDEEGQQPKLGLRQIDQIAVARPHFAFDEVEDAMIKGMDAWGRGPLGAPGQG